MAKIHISDELTCWFALLFLRSLKALATLALPFVLIPPRFSLSLMSSSSICSRDNTGTIFFGDFTPLKIDNASSSFNCLSAMIKTNQTYVFGV